MLEENVIVNKTITVVHLSYNSYESSGFSIYLTSLNFLN